MAIQIISIRPYLGRKSTRCLHKNPLANHLDKFEFIKILNKQVVSCLIANQFILAKIIMTPLLQRDETYYDDPKGGEDDE